MTSCRVSPQKARSTTAIQLVDVRSSRSDRAAHTARLHGHRRTADVARACYALFSHRRVSTRTALRRRGPYVRTVKRRRAKAACEYGRCKCSRRCNQQTCDEFRIHDDLRSFLVTGTRRGCSLRRAGFNVDRRQCRFAGRPEKEPKVDKTFFEFRIIVDGAGVGLLTPRSQVRFNSTSPLRPHTVRSAARGKTLHTS